MDEDQRNRIAEEEGCRSRIQDAIWKAMEAGFPREWVDDEVATAIEDFEADV